MPQPPETNDDRSLRHPHAATRLELLIAPDDALPPGNAAARCLGRTLRDSYEMDFACDGYRIVVCADRRISLPDGPQASGGLDIIEGPWPEPVGLRVRASTADEQPCWSVESDRYGLRPVFHGFDRRRRPIVSTRPEVVAALTGARLSAESLAEHLLVGFNLDDHSPFADVRRLRPRHRLTCDARRGLRIEPVASERRPSIARHGEDLGWIDELRPTVVDALKRGAALELSGGVDSRLVLAIGLSAGVRPSLAFTLGDDNDEDVRLAALICRRFDIRHLTVPVAIDPDRLASDGLDFAMRCGFGVNACSCAWLPHAFRGLAPRRDVQMGGGGGECAWGFYYSPLDFLCAAAPARRAWVRRRLFTGGVDPADVFDHHAAKVLATQVAQTALRLLSDGRGTWRRRTDAFYLAQRVPNAGGPVLSASACWYEPVQPLLHEPHIEWGRSLSTFQRADRRRQMNIIHRLNPDLAGIPFSHGRRYVTGAVRRIRRDADMFRSKGRKILSRLGGRRRAPDLGAAAVAGALADDPSVRRSLERLAGQSELPVRAECVAEMIDGDGAREHELGVLLSAAWAAEAADTVAATLNNASTSHPRRAA